MALVVFRADAGPAIGSGHVMRCLSLASIFAEGGWEIGFAANDETYRSVAALSETRIRCVSLPDAAADEPPTMRQQWQEGANILVVDHYERGAVFEHACRGWARRILVLDDLANRDHDADVLVDAGNSSVDYRGLVGGRCKILAGPEYAIVHAAFRMIRDRALARRDGRSVGRVLVSFGQGDAPNATMRALTALDQVHFSGEVDAVLGRAAPHLNEVQARANGRIRVHVDAREMHVLMTHADIAIGAGGVTTWERCCLGLPSVVVTLADNQVHQADIIAQEGAAISVGRVDAGIEWRLADALRCYFGEDRLRIAAAQAASGMVDGHGCARIIAALG